MVDVKSGKDRKAFGREADRVFALAAAKTRTLADRWAGEKGAPVFTMGGKYTLRGWTEWTQGFQFGNALLVYEAIKEPWFLEYGRSSTLSLMTLHLTNFGVHDHGFNNISTYGNLSRMMAEGTVARDEWEAEFYRLALKVSGAVQAKRWTHVPDSLGFIYSFNGAHSLFADTIRSLRVLAVAHSLGQSLCCEQDKKVSLLARLLRHAETTARYNVYFGNGRDRWDIPGRVAHESLFNVEGGSYRCPSTQQGYSAFSTWTRGLAWIILGYAEELEYLATLSESEFPSLGLPYAASKQAALDRFEEVARVTCDFYIENSPPDGIPYWDTGAPNLWKLPDHLDRPADPWNPCEPVDASAAAIAAQGFLRLAGYLAAAGRQGAERYEAAGLRLALTLMDEPYLSTDPKREGLLLHSVYHLPNGWDASPDSSGLPRGESCMWGDYHLLELALFLKRAAEGRQPQRFFTVA
ncbi:MAG: glycosyl hydrolase [Spirochaetes bacterium]|nr:glycosyl hydrolase [Spirochaetota bacterium]